MPDTWVPTSTEVTGSIVPVAVMLLLIVDISTADISQYAWVIVLLLSEQKKKIPPTTTIRARRVVILFFVVEKNLAIMVIVSDACETLNV